jgi:leader peptidase (prepilin peptidase)/N-methyltransferase
MNLIIGLFVFILGLIIGSFLAAFTYRFPRRRSVLKGRSKCTSCGKEIAWYDNIPLFSYILLKGKCRKCGKAISKRYLLIELLTGLSFLFFYFVIQSCSTKIVSLIFSSPICIWQKELSFFALPFVFIILAIIVAIFVIDYEHQFIPDELVFAGYGLIFLVLVFFNPSKIYVNLLTSFGGAISLLFIHLVTKGKGMGLGDVKFALMAGLLLGWPFTPIFLFLAFLTGALVGIILVLTKKAKLKERIAFGPFLVISLVITFLFGDQLITLFL